MTAFPEWVASSTGSYTLSAPGGRPSWSAAALAQPCAGQGDERARWALIVNTIGQNSYEVSIERGFEYELRWDGVYRRRAGGGA